MSAQQTHLPEYQLLIPTKICATCKRQDVEFGGDRSRADGLNMRCKRCNREKVQAIRNRRYELIAAGVALKPKEPKPIPAIVEARTPIGRVRQALRNGSRTITEIRHKTGMLEDHIDGILATLVLVRHEVEIYDVKIEVSSEVRVGAGAGDYIEAARMYRLKTIQG